MVITMLSIPFPISVGLIHTYVACVDVARWFAGGDETTVGEPVSDFGESAVLDWLFARNAALFRAAGAAPVLFADTVVVLLMPLLLWALLLAVPPPLFVVLTVDMRLILLWLVTLMLLEVFELPLFAPTGGYSCMCMGMDIEWIRDFENDLRDVDFCLNGFSLTWWGVTFLNFVIRETIFC